jgi:cytochrome c oxidase subunit 4
MANGHQQTAGAAAAHGQPSIHIVPPRVYVTIFSLLMVLTAITVSVAFVDLGPFNTIIALLIAVVKMVLVILYFMHVRYSGRLTWIVILAGFFWLALLLLMTLGDYLTRGSGWLRYG